MTSFIYSIFDFDAQLDFIEFALSKQDGLVENKLQPFCNHLYKELRRAYQEKEVAGRHIEPHDLLKMLATSVKNPESELKSHSDVIIAASIHQAVDSMINMDQSGTVAKINAIVRSETDTKDGTFADSMDTAH